MAAPPRGIFSCARHINCRRPPHRALATTTTRIAAARPGGHRGGLNASSSSRLLLLSTSATSSSQQQHAPNNTTTNNLLSFDVTAATFQQAVLRNRVPVVLDCYADWCGPCKQLAPLLKTAVAKTNGRVALALLDTDREPELADSLQIKSLPTVFGVVGGKLADHFTGGQPADVVDAFVARLALRAPPSPEDDAGTSDADEASVVIARAEQLLEAENDAAGASQLLAEAYAALKEEADRPKTKTGTRRGLSKEFDEKAPESAKMAALLEALGRCAVHARDVDAARKVLGDLRDPKRSAVLDGHAPLKAAVARLALAIADLETDHLGGASTSSEGAASSHAAGLAAARAKFASGDSAAAIDDALELVVEATTADEKNDARQVVLAFIDALGAVPAAAKARKRLANALFR